MPALNNEVTGRERGEVQDGRKSSVLNTSTTRNEYHFYFESGSLLRSQATISSMDYNAGQQLQCDNLAGKGRTNQK